MGQQLPGWGRELGPRTRRWRRVLQGLGDFQAQGNLVEPERTTWAGGTAELCKSPTQITQPAVLPTCATPAPGAVDEVAAAEDVEDRTHGAWVWKLRV